MALPETNGTHIQTLPEEVIECVMSFVPLRDRKSASLVCRSWSAQAFSHRNLANVRLIIKKQEIIDRRIQKNVEVLMNSSRRYHNLAVKWDAYPGDILWILDVLGESVETFCDLSWFALTRFEDIAQRLPRLKEILANPFGRFFFHPEELPVLKNLVSFSSTEFVFNRLGIEASRVMPHLRSLRVDFRYNTTIDFYKAIRWLLYDSRHFETLMLRVSTSEPPSLSLLFPRITMLKELYILADMTGSLLDVICNNCPKLTTFQFKAGFWGSLLILEKLRELKVCEDRVSF